MAKKGESEVSTLTRIMTNFVQILTLSAAFDLNYPSYFLDSITPMMIVGESAESFLSIDCFISDSKLFISFSFTRRCP